MKILHTSDWHLGRSLYGNKRYDEFTAYLEWLGETIKKEQIDILLVAGDVFDNTTPGSHAQELYYRFLCRIAGCNCQHIVIIAGNHDSPSFLEAPKELLKIINVHVIGNVAENIEKEILSLDNKNNEPGIIIGAVPYLRENEMRKPEAGETFDDKNQKLKEGIANHYSAITKKALEIKNNFKKEKKKNIPIILMGHLFTAEGKTTDGDGVRELYVGSLAHVKAGIFSDCVDYVALGHLHISQKVGKKENIRYSGSPLPIGFGEAKQQKQVIIVEFPEVIDYDMKITEINIPCFQRLELIKGDILKIQKRINELENDDEKVYIEIQYTGDDVIANLKEKVDKLTSGTKLEVLRIKNKQFINIALKQNKQEETLDELTEEDVFKRCLNANEIPEEQQKAFQPLFSEVMNRITSNKTK